MGKEIVGAGIVVDVDVDVVVVVDVDVVVVVVDVVVVGASDVSSTVKLIEPLLKFGPVTVT